MECDGKKYNMNTQNIIEKLQLGHVKEFDTLYIRNKGTSGLQVDLLNKEIICKVAFPQVARHAETEVEMPHSCSTKTSRLPKSMPYESELATCLPACQDLELPLLSFRNTGAKGGEFMSVHPL